MGTKYSSVSVTGYNATPPADDGTVSEANKIKWSTIKTKLPDPLNTAISSINSALTTHFNVGPTALTTNTTLGASHYNQFIQVSGSSVTLTLSDASTLAAGWFCWIRNNGTANVTLARATSGDTINTVAADVTLYPQDAFLIVVNAAGNGFTTVGVLMSMPFSAAPLKAQLPIASNYSLTATVGSSALTIALKGADGNDPSVLNPVYVPFRNVTQATGTQTWVAVTAATSLVVSSGSTLGTTSGALNKLAVGCFNDGGTFRLGIVCINGTVPYFVNDDVIASSTAEGGAGAADSAGVIYTGTAVSSKAFKVLGLVESTQATAGTWATAPSKIQLGSDWAKATSGGGSSYVLLSTKTAAASATLQFDTSDFTNSGYDVFEFRGVDLKPANNDVAIHANVSTDNASTWKTTYQCGGMYAEATNGPFTPTKWGTATLTNITLTTDTANGVESNDNAPLNFTLRIFAPSATSYPRGEWRAVFRDATNGLVLVDGAFNFTTTGAWNAIKFFANSGNITSGVIRLYGVKNS